MLLRILGFLEFRFPGGVESGSPQSGPLAMDGVGDRLHLKAVVTNQLISVIHRPFSAMRAEGINHLTGWTER